MPARQSTHIEENEQDLTPPSAQEKAEVQRSVAHGDDALRLATFFSRPSADTSPVSEHLFRREGEYWTLAFEGTVCRIKDSRGLHYLAQLLQYPHEEFHAIQLVTAGVDRLETDPSGAPRRSKDEPIAPESLARSGFTDTGDVLDPQARAAYKQRLIELRTQVEEAQAFHDLGRAEKLQEEIAFLTHELVQAVGLGGRVRKGGSSTERARVNVTRTIRLALKRITDSHPALGRHLTHTIKTGTYCSYTPDPRRSIVWQT